MAHEHEKSAAKSSFRKRPVSQFPDLDHLGVVPSWMVWFLLSAMGGYGAQEGQPWLVPAVVALTVSYGILMLLLWPHEEASTTKQIGQPAKL